MIFRFDLLPIVPSHYLFLMPVVIQYSSLIKPYKKCEERAWLCWRSKWNVVVLLTKKDVVVLERGKSNTIHCRALGSRQRYKMNKVYPFNIESINFGNVIYRPYFSRSTTIF